MGQNLYDPPAGTHSRVSSPENLNGLKGNRGRSNAGAKGSEFTSVKAGQTATLLNVRLSRVIRLIWLTVDDRSPEMLSRLRPKMYWDNSKIPAVDVPLGDFFCAPFGPVAFESELFSDPEGRSFNCYIPMPSKTGARITLTNESGKDLNLLFFDVDYIVRPVKKSLFFMRNGTAPKVRPSGRTPCCSPK